MMVSKRNILAFVSAVALGGVLVPTPAAATEVPAIPDDVLSIFTEWVPLHLAQSSLTPAKPGDAIDEDRLQYPSDVQVGKPVTVMTWGGAFLSAAQPSVRLLESFPDGLWMAPLLSQGIPVGTVQIQYLQDGTLAPGYDDDIAVAGALVLLRPGEVLATSDGDGFFVFSGDRVRQIGTRFRPTTTASVRDLQGAIVERREEYQRELEQRGVDILYGYTPIDLADYATRHGHPFVIEEPLAGFFDSSAAPRSDSPGIWILIPVAAIGLGFVVAAAMAITRRIRRHRFV